MSEYFIRRKDQTSYEVRKFTEVNNAVQSLYTVSVVKVGKPKKGKQDFKLTCDCHSGVYRPNQLCRHGKMVIEFLKQGEPVPFSMEWK